MSDGQDLNLFPFQVLETLSKVMDTNPDHLEAQGVEHMYNLLSSPQVPKLATFIIALLITMFFT